MKAIKCLFFIFIAGFFLASCATSSDLSDLPSEEQGTETYPLYAQLAESAAPLAAVIIQIDCCMESVHLGRTSKGEYFPFLKKATVRLDENGYEYRVWVRSTQTMGTRVSISGLFDKNPGKWLYLETEAIPQALRQYSLPEKEGGVEVEVVTTEGN